MNSFVVSVLLVVADKRVAMLQRISGNGGHMSRAWKMAGAVVCWLGLAGSPAFAQADFTGTWGARYQEDFAERIPGPDLGDYLGLPINASARQFADSWDPSRITLPEEQCRVHVAPYIY